MNIFSKQVRRHQSLVWIRYLFLALAVSGLTCKKSGNNNVPEVVNPQPVESTFVNPLMSGADPSVFQRDGSYYYLQTTGNNIRLWKTDAMSGLATAPSKVVFTPAAGAPNSRNIWAPELFFLDNKWYIYFTAGDGADLSQRTWVLENANPDPTVGTWTEKGKIYNPQADFWAIDATVMEYNNNRYLIWCGRPDKTNADLTQMIYISRMSNPWTLEGPVSLISQPTLAWERNGFPVNEAPQLLRNEQGNYYLIYSASYCGTDEYSLGLLALKPGGDPMIGGDWQKRSTPVFSSRPSSNAYGPGHNSFFKSPDGKETWLIYHANSNRGEGCADKRNIRMQKITFGADGSPDLGEPVAAGLKVTKPSGEK